MGEHQRLVVAGDLRESDKVLGASIAVSGVCLTVVHADDSSFAADVGFETLRCTKLGAIRVGDAVNLEPALRLGDSLGGHLVSGHVDGLGKLIASEARGEARELWFEAPDALLQYIAAKGSICIDGVSLTVNQVQANRFMVGIVPHTLRSTTLGSLQIGDSVHLEVDLVARYVVRWLEVRGEKPESKLDLSVLQRAGFLKENHE